MFGAEAFGGVGTYLKSRKSALRGGICQKEGGAYVKNAAPKPFPGGATCENLNIFKILHHPLRIL